MDIENSKKHLSELQEERRRHKITLPDMLKRKVVIKEENNDIYEKNLETIKDMCYSLNTSNDEKECLKMNFPNIINKPIIKLCNDPYYTLNMLDKRINTTDSINTSMDMSSYNCTTNSLMKEMINMYKPHEKLNIGILFTGQQAPGGHNIICGVFDCLKKKNKKNTLYGFMNGFQGMLKYNFMELKNEYISMFRNSGGFDMIKSSDIQIIKEDQKKKCFKICRQLNLNGLIVIGDVSGIKSAAILSEYFETVYKITNENIKREELKEKYKEEEEKEKYKEEEEKEKYKEEEEKYKELKEKYKEEELKEKYKEEEKCKYKDEEEKCKYKEEKKNNQGEKKKNNLEDNNNICEILQNYVQEDKIYEPYNIIDNNKTCISNENNSNNNIQYDNIQSYNISYDNISTYDFTYDHISDISDEEINKKYPKKNKTFVKTSIVSAPTCIYNEMKNKYIECSLGFDTTIFSYCQYISYLITHIQTYLKGYHFIKVMGNSSSHIALECFLQTKVNIILVSEEIKKNNLTLDQIIQFIVDVIQNRYKKYHKKYGIVIIPDGILKKITQFKKLVTSIINIKTKFIKNKINILHDLQNILSKHLIKEQEQFFKTLPDFFQIQLLEEICSQQFHYDRLSTELLLTHLVKKKLEERQINDLEFHTHSYGNEVTCSLPTNFDCAYSYILGFSCVEMLQHRYNGYMCVIKKLKNLLLNVNDIEILGIPLCHIMQLKKKSKNVENINIVQQVKYAEEKKKKMEEKDNAQEIKENGKINKTEKLTKKNKTEKKDKVAKKDKTSKKDKNNTTDRVKKSSSNIQNDNVNKKDDALPNDDVLTNDLCEPTNSTNKQNKNDLVIRNDPFEQFFIKRTKVNLKDDTYFIKYKKYRYLYLYEDHYRVLTGIQYEHNFCIDYDDKSLKFRNKLNSTLSSNDYITIKPNNIFTKINFTISDLTKEYFNKKEHNEEKISMTQNNILQNGAILQNNNIYKFNYYKQSSMLSEIEKMLTASAIKFNTILIRHNTRITYINNNFFNKLYTISFLHIPKIKDFYILQDNQFHLKQNYRNVTSPKNVGVVLLSHCAPGTNNILVGLHQRLSINNFKLIGFIKGLKGLLNNDICLINDNNLKTSINIGGFPLLGVHIQYEKKTNDDQILHIHDLIKENNISKIIKSCKNNNITNLVFIGDEKVISLMNILNDIFINKDINIKIVAIPISLYNSFDKNLIECSIGYHSMVRHISDIISNVQSICLNINRYYYFIKIHTNISSSLILSVQLETHCNICYIGESVNNQLTSLHTVIENISLIIIERINRMKYYGVILFSSNLIYYINDFHELCKDVDENIKDVQEIDEIVKNDILPERFQKKLKKESVDLLNLFTEPMKDKLLRKEKRENEDIDSNFEVMLINEIKKYIQNLMEKSKQNKELYCYKKHMNTISSPINVKNIKVYSDIDYILHFQTLIKVIDREINCFFPTHFDNSLAFSHGLLAGIAVENDLLNYVTSIKHLNLNKQNWSSSLYPGIYFINNKDDKGHFNEYPSVAPVPISMKSSQMATMKYNANTWAFSDSYIFVGPVQYSVNPDNLGYSSYIF
ncbi:6-phosphofructokinase [Plasmodium sp. DRC-Itaito]|nr:6-phosphofructokinase [Plasmodium sp. DRC-Itaito]